MVDANVLKKKSGDEAVQVMDYKVADLRKKLNKLKYESGRKTDRIARLMKDYEKVVNMNAEMVKYFHFVLVLKSSFFSSTCCRRKQRRSWKTRLKAKDCGF